MQGKVRIMKEEFQVEVDEISGYRLTVIPVRKFRLQREGKQERQVDSLLESV